MRMPYDDRYGKVLDLAEAIGKRRGEIIDQAVRDIRFTVRDTATEVDIAVDRLKMYDGARSFLEDRRPLGGDGSGVSLMLSYNGSAWLNTAITSLWMVGNRVNVKFSSKGTGICDLTESLYRPIFGDDIRFFRGSGKSFLERSLRDPTVSSVVVFGFDENVLPYEEAFRRTGKKLVFEGPGQDPFIVFPDADLSLALSDLMTAKFMYSGQTCTAPKRIFVHRSLYEEFLDRFAERAARLVVGKPEEERTDVSPVASDLAVARIRAQLADAVAKGAKILLGGTVEGNLVHPTIVREATDDMLGMREEVFGPVAFTSAFETKEEVVRRAKDHRYGLRAAVFGGREAEEAAGKLAGGAYCHPVSGYTFGKFGTVALNQTRAESWKGAFVVKAVGGYGYSGWIWETEDGAFRIKQGPKLLSVETSRNG
ncbi:MAG TPA: aldehyde dehydrogenase family protein [Candidatus Deferrimicrobiaceae bacterium]|nr:aldehyde dehydrogenase family protein [Candidatus Deferrimicrobiaceae bacterium]